MLSLRVKLVWKDVKLRQELWRRSTLPRRLLITSSATRDESPAEKNKCTSLFIVPSFCTKFSSFLLLLSSSCVSCSLLCFLSLPLRPWEGWTHVTDRPGSRDKMGGLLRPEHVWGSTDRRLSWRGVWQMKPFKGLKRVGCCIISWCKMEGWTEAL